MNIWNCAFSVKTRGGERIGLCQVIAQTYAECSDALRLALETQYPGKWSPQFLIRKQTTGDEENELNVQLFFHIRGEDGNKAVIARFASVKTPSNYGQLIAAIEDEHAARGEKASFFKSLVF